MFIKAKDMRDLIKNKKRKDIKMKRLVEQSQVANPKVIEYWLDRIEKEGSRYFQCYSSYDDEEIYDPMDLEVCHNFKAYQKAFAKLGYKLFQINDAYGCGWAITF